MTVQLKVTTKGLRDAQGRFTKVVEGMELTFRQRLQMLMRALREETRGEAPVNLGKYIGYRTQVFSTSPVRMQGSVVLKRLPSRYPAKLWDYIIEGTHRHVIKARRAKALHFYWDKMGKAVFFKRVMHPGTRPNDFASRAFRKVGQKNIQAAAKDIGLAVLARLEGRR